MIHDHIVALIPNYSIFITLFKKGILLLSGTTHGMCMILPFDMVHYRLEKMLLRNMLKDGIGCAR